MRFAVGDIPLANARASSAGESRIIRMGYGAAALYTRWAARSLQLGNALFREIRIPLFLKTGVLWLCSKLDPYTQELLRILVSERIPHDFGAAGALAGVEHLLAPVVAE